MPPSRSKQPSVDPNHRVNSSSLESTSFLTHQDPFLSEVQTHESGITSHDAEPHTGTKICNRSQKIKKKKADGKPRRPLSAYNLFFRAERKILLEKLPVRPQGKPRRSHGKMSFVPMVRLMGSRWKALNEESKAVFEAMATKEKQRYQKKLDEYNKRKDQDLMKTRPVSINRCILPDLKVEEGTFVDPLILREPVYALDEEPLDRPDKIAELASKLDDDMIDILVQHFA